MYQAKIASKGDRKYHATTRDSHFELGVGGSNPVDAMLASLCGCLGHYVGDFLHEEKIIFSEYIVSADTELTKDKSRLADINIAIEVKDAPLSEIKKSQMLKFISKCYIYNTLQANSKIIFKIVSDKTL
jgi:uncharacterized OsmC-like protein